MRETIPLAQTLRIDIRFHIIAPTGTNCFSNSKAERLTSSQQTHYKSQEFLRLAKHKFDFCFMPVNIKYLESFQENEFMHVIAKAVGLNVLFRNDGNKIYFLSQYFKYLSEYVDTYCFCLLDNHVHWLVKCKSRISLMNSISQLDPTVRKKHQQEFLNDKINFERAVEYQWKDFFISYALSFNTRYKRHGTLFVNPFRRVAVLDKSHLLHLIIYIHANPIKHRIKKDIDDCHFTSYHSILGNKETKLKRLEVLDLFGGMDQFIELHQNTIDYYYVHPKSME